MAEIDIDALLASLPGAAPCGPDLEYDPEFLKLEEVARGKPEQQFGDTVIAALPPDWRAMKDQAAALLARTRDLRVAMHLLRADTRLSGFSGFSRGLNLLHGLLAQHWPHVHPQLDASDHNDPTMRLNALAPLADIHGVLADLRQATLGDPRAGITVRQIELAVGKADLAANEVAPQPTSLANAIADANDAAPGLLNAMLLAHTQTQFIQTLIDDHSTAGPELRSLHAITQTLADMAHLAADDVEVVTAVSSEHGANPVKTMAGTSGGAIQNRVDAIQTLDRVCEWILRNEPTNPAPLLIRRAQRLMTKSFLDIIRDLAPDGLKDVERIAGVEPE
jgi:type VI secretion system protein ImpA